MLNEILSSITTAFSDGEEVKINDFDAFQVAEKRGRKGLNPQTGEEITIVSSKSPQFKAAEVLKGICSICNRHSDVGLFTAKTKGPGQDNYIKRGNYVCVDNEVCNRYINNTIETPKFGLWKEFLLRGFFNDSQ